MSTHSIHLLLYPDSKRPVAAQAILKKLFKGGYILKWQLPFNGSGINNHYTLSRNGINVLNKYLATNYKYVDRTKHEYKEFTHRDLITAVGINIQNHIDEKKLNETQASIVIMPKKVLVSTIRPDVFFKLRRNNLLDLYIEVDWRESQNNAFFTKIDNYRIGLSSGNVLKLMVFITWQKENYEYIKSLKHPYIVTAFAPDLEKPHLLSQKIYCYSNGTINLILPE